MIEDLKSTDIINKVGGRFKLSALIQKRMLEIMQGARPLIEDTEGKTPMEIVVAEILQDKIAVDYGTGEEGTETPKL
ncbi:MAG TPA: DNA-directed RNA polymerase subunit omega [Planctomycetes bacterium]|nr:DNA-directed RNA polymerase subunit omega [Planctomycetota bacterium]HIJ70245.1 DNA-directed RNA polymerase subunit omega [Planctomycetota bacterium]